MKDTDLMPYGKFKGKKMIDVPCFYLLWLLENNKCSGAIKTYIQDNKQVLEQEARKLKNK